MIKHYEKIAVAIDFSKLSMKAFQRAILVAKDNNASMQLVNVIDTKSFGSVAAYDLEYAERLKEERITKMDELKNEVIAAGVPIVEVTIKEGAPEEILTQLPGVELLICGATGVSNIEKMVIGSVAERIVSLANCDVQLVR
ncbi:universal stress protein [Ureibacillus sinduriensis]|uniref:Universal stress protein UspA n=1 Tax=Ureibacillus sinduriensis BLB-1 = JCM 15800 TaxID=1384057 RepID=A0A0A3HT74_9BACL|nr:universal stress protein [Ureibacillus sinduriensis]KGR74405.1 universal stress protein UspA [Ureibacillus sinduriensis BLB-1 = JCM 15800]